MIRSHASCTLSRKVLVDVWFRSCGRAAAATACACPPARAMPSGTLPGATSCRPSAACGVLATLGAIAALTLSPVSLIRAVPDVLLLLPLPSRGMLLALPPLP